MDLKSMYADAKNAPLIAFSSAKLCFSAFSSVVPKPVSFNQLVVLECRFIEGKTAETSDCCLAYVYLGGLG